MSSPFHLGERRAQALASVAEPRGAGIRDVMPDQHRDFFALLPWILVATVDGDGWPVPTVLAGTPGFVASPDPRTLQIAAQPQATDPAAALLSPGAPVGLLGIDLATRRRNRANGNVAAADDGVHIGVTQSFGNCAQYINLRSVAPATAQAATLQPFDGLSPEAARLIAAADTFFVASHAGDVSGVDISHRGGPAGFVRIDGARLTVPDYKGNRFFNTFGNLLLQPRAALLFVDFTTGDLLVVQGEARIDWQADRSWALDVARGWFLRGAVPLRWTPMDG